MKKNSMLLKKGTWAFAHYYLNSLMKSANSLRSFRIFIVNCGGAHVCLLYNVLPGVSYFAFVFNLFACVFSAFLLLNLFKSSFMFRPGVVFCVGGLVCWLIQIVRLQCLAVVSLLFRPWSALFGCCCWFGTLALSMSLRKFTCYFSCTYIYICLVSDFFQFFIVKLLFSCLLSV